MRTPVVYKRWFCSSQLTWRVASAQDGAGSGTPTRDYSFGTRVSRTFVLQDEGPEN